MAWREVRYEDPLLLATIIDCVGKVVLVLFVTGYLLAMILLAVAGFGGAQ